ncbi:MAG: 5-methyltetrahydropteroyltriglutamate--homocysteine S-methyltransferase [Rickettsiaceae bacterium]|jgi:5-methyltetrahydropteroyltriglutamate--homocysteine methyltransferase|nr:5-methyltetrahydropteroyltriglutamate--homocysteine S-methyltransferase [Rickettsiaceae bacterium]
MSKSATLGFPRIGAFRELKKVVESYWKNSITKEELLNTAKEIRKTNWLMQKNAGINFIPSNDFSFYDHILGTVAMVGAVPERFGPIGKEADLDLFFTMARGGKDKVAMEMTKWFDTNYHYLVPELKKDQKFSFWCKKIVDHYLEAKELGIETRPVLVGPLTFLLLGKMVDGGNALDLLPNLLPVYEEVFAALKQAGVKDVQIDEPCLVTNLSSEALNCYVSAYKKINSFAGNINLHLATYFDDLGSNIDTAFALDTASVHIDLVRAPQQLEKALNAIGSNQTLSLGLVDGRNIWINDLENSIALAKKVVEKLGSDRIIIASSCSLLHSPVDLDSEKNLDPEIKSWLAFAKQKLAEINAINQTILGKKDADLLTLLEDNRRANELRKTSAKIHDKAVKQRVSSIKDSDMNRTSDFATRKRIQTNQINLPILPTTTIGSFPQTKEVRKYRADFKAGKITPNEYKKFLQEETTRCIRFQESIDLDVLVHGEFERNDMVEYFGEQLSGFAFTEYGWVQSYGSRCVKPPIIFGDVSRPKPMTVEWAVYAQSQTKKIMKGMLTGPITILQWSFVRNDQPRKDTALQIAFAIRDEVIDLEKAGIKIIQIDEAALREGLPIRKENWSSYLKWAVEAFRITASGVNDRTQIHTHMCYSEFNDIINDIAKMDADVISIETSRSNMELLNAFVTFKYPNEIGPGVYDIHSPRVPKTSEMVLLLKKALDVLKAEQIWVNPDCGLKTRDWPETKEALVNMVEAAKLVRAEL